MPGFSETGHFRFSPVSDDRPVLALAAAFRHLLEAGVRDRTLFAEIMRQTLENQPNLLAVWTVWEPNALDGRDAVFRHAPGHDASGRFIACWHRASGPPRLEATTGYDAPERAVWYWYPKRRGAACRLDPIAYPLGGRRVWLVSRVAPLSREGRFLGVVGTDFPARPPREASGQRPCAHPLGKGAEDCLTPREREVLHWLREGKTNEEIGLILGVSRHTVKNHLERIYQKLGIHSRYQAMHPGAEV